MPDWYKGATLSKQDEDMINKSQSKPKKPVVIERADSDKVGSFLPPID